MRRARPLALAAILAAALAAPAAASGAPAIHAHRGGSVIDGVPTYPENTMPAFRNAAKHGWVLELDAELTKDRIPVALHDSTLDRTTACSGPVYERTWAELRDCPSDVLGSPGSEAGGRQMTDREKRVPIPRLTEVLDLARRTGATLNIEIKNIPTEAGFDATDAFAERVVDDIAAAGLDPSQVIVQSFWPENLEVSERRMPAVATSLLTLSPLNDGAPAFAASRGYEWVSPQWPADPAAVGAAQALGLGVVPFTLDDPQTVADAAAEGVDALITNDPPMAERALG